MIFNINSTRGHTGSLLVFTIDATGKPYLGEPTTVTYCILPNWTTPDIASFSLPLKLITSEMFKMAPQAATGSRGIERQLADICCPNWMIY